VQRARETGCDAIAHGATGKGNDQVRFELGAYALWPEVKIIAPWREWELNSREKLLDYAAQHNIPIAKKKDGGSPYSMDANALHISYEGGGLEDPWWTPDDSIWRWTRNPEDAPEQAELITIAFEGGDPVAIDGERLSPYTLLDRLNQLGGKHGIGRLDLVENRYVGIKSRGCYETPGGTILLKAHRAIESLCLDREQAHLKDELMPRYASLVYYGYWWSPERRMLQALIDESQQRVNGEVRLKLYKGNVYNAGRRSPDSLFDARLSTFEDDRGAYNQKDAEGFIRLNGLRLRTAAKRDQT
jgi:argininosuccinate synthase